VLRVVTTAKRQTEFMGQQPRHDEPLLPSLALAALQASRPEATVSGPGGYLNYLGPDGTIPTIPIEELFDPGRWNSSWLRGGQLFRDQVVWVGWLSDLQFKDSYVTPLGRMAGVETQAQAFETLRGRGVLRPFSWAATLACVWLLALAGVIVAGAALRVSVQLAIVVGVVLAWGGLALGLFFGAGLVLPMVAPLGAWLVAGGGGAGVRFIMEQRERRRLRGMLGRYVSEEVARIIVEQPEEFSQSLRGGRRPVTVLFADLRGFTSWVEQAEPEAFVAQLNEYFSAVVDCVLAQGGTLQKFIGDAVLTVWGDTRSAGAATDTARAVDAALAMQAAVTRLNAAWAGRPDRTPMAIGIGLHHGVAMVGNVGHAQRMEFTVLGDVVNVAARLESANRQLDTTVLVSETVRDLIVATHRCVPLGRFGLKGRREAVGLFVPLGPQSEPAPDWLAPADAALAAWTRGDFSSAATAYAELAGRPTPLAEFFAQQAERARRFVAAPPAEWQGAYRFDSK
jgi:adenylate cyclase